MKLRKSETLGSLFSTDKKKLIDLWPPNTELEKPLNSDLQDFVARVYAEISEIRQK